MAVMELTASMGATEKMAKTGSADRTELTVDGQDGVNGQDGAAGQDGQNGTDGVSIIVLDPETLSNPGLVETLETGGFDVVEAPNGYAYVAFEAHQLQDLIGLVETYIASQEQEAQTFEETNTEDYLVGNNQNNTISAFGADDVLIGLAGADTLLRRRQ